MHRLDKIAAALIVVKTLLSLRVADKLADYTSQDYWKPEQPMTPASPEKPAWGGSQNSRMKTVAADTAKPAAAGGDFYRSDKFRKMDPYKRIEHFDSHFSRVGSKYGIKPEVLKSIAYAESEGNPYAKSKANAQGLMQITPITAKQISKIAKRKGVSFGDKGFDPYNPEHAIEGGALYWNWLKKRVDTAAGGRQMDPKERKDLVLMAYNWGPGNLKKYVSGESDKPEESKIHSKRFWKAYSRLSGGQPES